MVEECTRLAHRFSVDLCKRLNPPLFMNGRSTHGLPFKLKPIEGGKSRTFAALTLIIHEASAAAADPGMSAAVPIHALYELGPLGRIARRTVEYACAILPSRALHPCPSAPPRDEPS